MTFNLVTIIIIITCIVSYNAFNNRDLMNKLMYIPFNVKNYKEHYRTFSHVLIHADWGHLLFNMMSFYFLGSALLSFLIGEYGMTLGNLHFAVIYILGGLFATILPYYRNQDNSSYRSLGASGAVSAIIFATIIWMPGMKLSLLFFPIDIPAYIFGPLYLLFEYYMDKRGGTGIAHDAHIGGAIFGVIYILIINFDKGKEFINTIF